jgi:Zn-finger nucleic acid-binding protein
MTADPLRCGNCGVALQRLVLDAHYAQRVEIDLCAPCHLVWFDAIESARLTGASVLSLLGAMAQAQREPHQLLRHNAGCPRCAGALKPVHNRSRWGHTMQLECKRRHGAYQSFAQFLSEKGFVRALSSADRAALTRRTGSFDCLNCGASIGPADSRCRYCDTLPGVFDVARLARALDPEGAAEGDAVRGVAAQSTTLHCLACGAPLSSGLATQCGHCGATLAVGRLAEAHAAVEGLGAALRAHQHRPAAHVRARRLERLRSDLPRRRAWVRDMEASAGPPPSDATDDDSLEGLFEGPARKRWVTWLGWGVLGLLLAWWLGAFR